MGKSNHNQKRIKMGFKFYFHDIVILVSGLAITLTGVVAVLLVDILFPHAMESTFYRGHFHRVPERFWFNELAIVFIVTGILTTFGLLIKTFTYKESTAEHLEQSSETNLIGCQWKSVSAEFSPIKSPSKISEV